MEESLQPTYEPERDHEARREAIARALGVAESFPVDISLEDILIPGAAVAKVKAARAAYELSKQTEQ